MAAVDGTTPLGGYLVGQRVAAAVTATQAETADAVLAAITVPKNAVVVDVILTTTDLDTGATGVVDVGDSDNDARFVSNFSIQAAGSIRTSDTDATAVHKYTADTDVEVTVSTGAATGASGTITLTILYFIDG